MKFFSLPKLILIILVSTILSCTTNTDDMNNDILPVFKSAETIREQVAKHYAPVFYQDVDVTDIFFCPNSSKTGSADWIAPINYDGDWIAHNNWENLISKGRDKGTLKGAVYYNFASTNSHWFVLYSVYHPRDWADSPWCAADSHENDLEGILICAERLSNNGFGNVLYAGTVYHSERKTYRASELLFEGNRAKAFIQAKGHGMRKYNGSTDEDGTHIVYRFNSDSYYVQQPSSRKNDLPQSVFYSLINTKAVLWPKRDWSDLFIGNSFNGDNYRDNAAHAPWGWGEIGTHPAKFIKDKFNLSSFNTNYDQKDF